MWRTWYPQFSLAACAQHLVSSVVPPEGCLAFLLIAFFSNCLWLFLKVADFFADNLKMFSCSCLSFSANQVKMDLVSPSTGTLSPGWPVKSGMSGCLPSGDTSGTSSCESILLLLYPYQEWQACLDPLKLVYLLGLYWHLHTQNNGFEKKWVNRLFSHIIIIIHCNRDEIEWDTQLCVQDELQRPWNIKLPSSVTM